MPRMDRGFKVRSEARENITSLPSEYLSKIYYDCLTHGPEELEYLVNRVGFDRVLLGSDFPFDMGLDSPPEWISQMPFLNDSSKEAILGGNAKGLLKI
jgi:aminocarboxymuconate-semialdehyde decarboxylase